MMVPEYIPSKALRVCTASASAWASTTPARRTSTVPSTSVRAPRKAAPNANRAAAAAATAAAEPASPSPAQATFSPAVAGPSPSLTLAASEYAAHVATRVEHARRLSTSAQNKLMGASIVDRAAGAASRAAEATPKKQLAVLMSVVDGLIDELHAAVTRSNYHELRAKDLADALANETSKCVHLTETLEASDRTIASLLEQVDLLEVQNNEVETNSGGDLHEASDSAGTHDEHDEHDEKRSPVEDPPQSVDENENDTAMVMAVFGVRELIAAKTNANEQMMKLHKRFHETLRARVQLCKIPPSPLPRESEYFIESYLKRVGMSIVNTPHFGNCQFDALLEAALGFSMLQLYDSAHAKNADPALMLQYDWAVDALGQLKRAIAACGMNRSEEQYDPVFLTGAVEETGRECVQDYHPAAVRQNLAILNTYWHAIATNTSHVREKVPFDEWGNVISLFQACKVLARPIYVLKLAAGTKAGVSFRRYVPVDPSGPASMFKSCTDSFVESFEEWTQVLLADVEAADADPCLMALVLVLQGLHYRSAVVDASALNNVEQVLGKMREPVAEATSPVVPVVPITSTAPKTVRPHTASAKPAISKRIRQSTPDRTAAKPNPARQPAPEPASVSPLSTAAQTATRPVAGRSAVRAVGAPSRVPPTRSPAPVRTKEAPAARPSAIAPPATAPKERERVAAAHEPAIARESVSASALLGAKGEKKVKAAPRWR